MIEVMLQPRSWVPFPSMNTTITRYRKHGAYHSTHNTVTSYKLTGIDKTKLHTTLAHNSSEYYSKCNKHVNCAGHMMLTPQGELMMPSTFSALVGTVENQYAKSSRLLLERDTRYNYTHYKTSIRKAMLTKRGVMRSGIMGGEVECSARLVIAPLWCQGRNVLALPKALFKSMCVVHKPVVKVDGEYIEAATFGTRLIVPGDYAIVVRAPSLWYGNIQPMRLISWHHSCIGFPVSNCEDYHADFDGDEVHVYPLADKGSIDEAKAWVDNAPSDCLDRKLYEHVPNEFRGNGGSIDATYMMHTTVSIKEALHMKSFSPLMKKARMKYESVSMWQGIMDEDMSDDTFVTLSINAMQDVMSQQLMQGPVGEISRQSRIACAGLEANTHLAQLAEVPVMPRSDAGAYGNGAMRAASIFSSLIQQSALDAHRVIKSSGRKFDIISSLFDSSVHHLIMVSSVRNVEVLWSKAVDNKYVCIIKPDCSIEPSAIIATYRPYLLRTISSRYRRWLACTTALRVLALYSGAKVYEDEIGQLASVLCYDCEVSDESALCKAGITVRNNRWLHCVYATHYGTIEYMDPKLLSSECTVKSIIEKVVFNSF